MELAQVIANSVVKQYPKKYSIIAVYGSTALKKNTEHSDVDMFAIVDYEPKDPNFTDTSKYGLQAVIKPLRAIDFYLMDWPQVEKCEGKNHPVWAVAASRIVNAKVLYYRNDSDLKRFQDFQEKTKNIDLNEQFAFASSVAGFDKETILKQCQKTNNILLTRNIAWQIINECVTALSRLNNVFLTHNWGHHLEEAFQNFEYQPKNFKEIVITLATTSDCNIIIEKANLLKEEIQKIKIQIQKKLKPIKGELDIVGLKEYIGKVISAAKRKDILGASWATNELQIWLLENLAECENGKSFGITQNLVEDPNTLIDFFEKKLSFPDLMIHITNNDFDGLLNAIQKMDERIDQYVKNNHIKYHLFDSTDHFFKEFE